MSKTIEHVALPQWIGGEPVPPQDSAYLPVVDPASGQTYAEVSRGSSADIDRAVAAARAAQVEWCRMAPVERGRALAAVGRAIASRRDELAALECREIGKPLSQANADVDIAARYFEFYGSLADKVRGTTIPLGEGSLDYTLREPLGVSAQIVPWNYPLQIGGRGMAAPLAAGNTVVVKPAEDGSTSLLRLARLAEEAGIPAGVINVVTGLGSEVGAALAAHPGVDQVTFTGSVETGIAVTRAAASNVVPVVLELGGKCPVLLFDDADLEAAVPVVLKGATQNAGQTCSGISRVLVDRRVHDEFVERLVSAAAALTVGPGLDDPDMGPVISAVQRGRVEAFVDAAREAGGEVVAGGSVPVGLPEGGFFYAPTVVDGVSPAMEIATEEVFGPVLAVLAFETEEEAVEIANGTRFGLVSGIWTRDVSRAHRVASGLESGQVFVNSYGAAGGVELPFGGYKASGFGREKGIEGLESYLQTKNVCVGL